MTAPVASRAWFRQPGWPLALLFVPFPLWWAMGISEFICFIMAVPMALYLLRLPRVQVPRGFGLWLLFLFWVILGVFVLRVSALGAVADNSSTRYLTWAYRLAWYVAITITLLYVINTRTELATARIARIVSALFLTVLAGGLLGMFAPLLEFPSLLELLLPKSISKIQFISKMIHPSAAQLQDVLGYAAPRPSAPYAFTNTWGLNFVCTLPFFVLGWCQRDSGWRRFAAIPILLIAAVPAIYSINRGMWLALVVMALFIALRAAFTGRPGLLLTVMGGGAALVLLVALTSLGSVVTTRLTSDGSEEGRANLGTLAVTSVAATSPVIGLGSTRNVQGNFNTIAGGARADCPRCSPPALGTQGQLWLVVFSQGLLGLLWYLAFFGAIFLRHLRLRTAATTAGLTVLVASVVTMPVYNSLGTGLLVTMIAVGLLVREGVTAGLPEPLLDSAQFIRPLTRWWPVVVAGAVVGLSTGTLIFRALPTQVRASTTIVLPQAPDFAFVTATDGPMTLDTIGQLLETDLVTTAVATATGRRPQKGDGTLTVRATPNSRTLHISVQARSVVVAERGSRAAATALLKLRQEQLAGERARRVRALQARAQSLSGAMAQLAQPIADTVPGKTRILPLWATYSLRAKRTAFETELGVINGQLARVSSVDPGAGSIIAPTRAQVRGDGRSVFMASGLGLGLGAGALLAIGFGRRGQRISGARRVPDGLDLPILARMRSGQLELNPAADPLTAAGTLKAAGSLTGEMQVMAQIHNFGSCRPARERDRQLRMEAANLTALVRAGAAERCVILARENTRSGMIRRAAGAVRASGQVAIGVVVLTDSASGRWPTGGPTMLDSGRLGAKKERKTGAENGDR